MITKTMFVLAVRDLAVSSDFYRSVLGFEIREIGDPGWRLFVRDQCHLMVGECPDVLPARDLGDHSYFAYLIVDDVDADYRRVCNNGADIIKSLRDEPWGMREFGIRTVDGHRIMFGMDLEK